MHLTLWFGPLTQRTHTHTHRTHTHAVHTQTHDTCTNTHRQFLKKAHLDIVINVRQRLVVSTHTHTHTLTHTHIHTHTVIVICSVLVSRSLRLIM